MYDSKDGLEEIDLEREPQVLQALFQIESRDCDDDTRNLTTAFSHSDFSSVQGSQLAPRLCRN